MNERKEMLAFMKELSNALISVRPLGGSELFVKRFDDYFADPAYCKAAIQVNHERYHAAMKETVRLRRALQFYADPFAWKLAHDPEDAVRVPDFYSETSFGDTASEALLLSVNDGQIGGAK